MYTHRKATLLLSVIALWMSATMLLAQNDKANELTGLSTNRYDTLAYCYGAMFGNQYTNFNEFGVVVPGRQMNGVPFIESFERAIRKQAEPNEFDDANDYLQQTISKLKEAEGDSARIELAKTFTDEQLTQLAQAYGIQFGTQYSNFTDPGVVVPDESVVMNLDLFLSGFKSAFWKDSSALLLSIDEAQAFLMAFQENLKAEMAAQQQKVIDENKARGAEYMAQNAKKKGVKVTESGLQIEYLNRGEGPSPVSGDKVKVNYKGMTIDGTVFDEHNNVDFDVDGLIAGFTEGLKAMCVGDKVKITIPSDLAYGDRGAGDHIPGGSTLVFEVQLLGIVGK